MSETAQFFLGGLEAMHGMSPTLSPAASSSSSTEMASFPAPSPAPACQPSTDTGDIQTAASSSSSPARLASFHSRNLPPAPPRAGSEQQQQSRRPAASSSSSTEMASFPAPSPAPACRPTVDTSDVQTAVSSSSSTSSSSSSRAAAAVAVSRNLPPALPRASSMGSAARPPRGDAGIDANGGASAERSNWGLFQRTVSVVREGGDAYKSLIYQCTPSQTVEFRQPLEGAGTTLMHGDFARKLSPSEEALAIYIIKHTRLFEGRRVMDVGAGLGFAGLVCATCANPAVLELSDGDPEVVNTLRSSVQLNLESFGDTQVDTRHVLWDRSEQWSERASMDIVIAADVVYLDFLHSPLLGMVSRVLKPGGVFLLFASRRNGSLEKFICQARSIFPTVEVTTDYDADVASAIGKHAKCFPVMVRLVAADTNEELPSFVTHLCEELREKRALQDKQAKAAERIQKQQNVRHRAHSQSLVESRKQRLAAEQEAFEAEEAERLAAEAASAEAKKLVAAAAAADARASPHLNAQPDWHLFPRQSTLSSDGAFKDIVYQVGGESLSIRRPLSSSGFLCGLSRKVSVSEEVLATWVVKRRRHLKRKRVLELGAGCGVAGLAAAMCTSAKHVEITDGDPSVLAMLQGNIALNSDSFSAKKVSSQQLEFGEMQDGLKPFDFILAADVLDADHNALMKTLRRLLKPSGTVIIFAAPTNSKMDSFVSAAKPVFDRVQVTQHYDDDVTRTLHGMSCFPKMIRMQRSDAFVPRAATPSASATGVDHSAARQPRPSSQPSAGTATEDQAEVVSAAGDRVANDDGIDGDCQEKKRKRRRDILVARGQRRSAARAVAMIPPIESGEPAVSQPEGCMHTGEDDMAGSDLHRCVTSARDMGLPSLAVSRSNSAQSIRVASDMSPINLGTGRHVADHVVLASGLCTPSSSTSASKQASTPTYGLSGSGGPLCASLPAEVASAIPAASFWSQLPNSGGAIGSFAREFVSKGTNGTGNADAWSRRGRSNSLPPRGNGKFPAGLLELSIDGSALAIQRCGVSSVKGKMRSARGFVCEPPRAPAVCA